MTLEQQKIINFYCKQLNITTVAQLQEIIKNNAIFDIIELINFLASLYNSDCYYTGITEEVVKGVKK
jgi:hypothetical protein